MNHRGLVVAVWLTMTVPGGSSPACAQERLIDLHRLVSDLNVTGRGAANWLRLLESNEHGLSTERLLAVTATGELLMERDGGASSVSLGSELDQLLRRQGPSVVLIHNHPSSVGLSAADIGHLAKPGVAAIVALGHDGNVFAASAGPAMERDSLGEQFAAAQAAVNKQLRTDRSLVPARARDAHLNHVVTQALAEAKVIQYWFALNDWARESYERARLIFGHAISAGATRLKRDLERPALHVYLVGKPKMVVHDAIAGAVRRLAKPECQRLFDDFEDSDRQPLGEVLRTLGKTPSQFLAALYFVDGDGSSHCASSPSTAAFTVPGSRVIRVCGNRFAERFARKTSGGEILIIHELLHTLGLGENPPMSAQITERVWERCR